MLSMEIAKAVARESCEALAKKDIIIKRQRWAIVSLAVALALSCMAVFVCVSKM